ncbi:FxsA family protein [Moraxella sp. FZLJ2107]|uniref:FxsA family protein n=1 Tax=unclassified Moraxella TaxID=2685852 RepID=UPI0020C855D9|nr:MULTISPECIES: FxsA family protein [unclassified Moraxella]UTO05213.1 FxsA family protein [Moraxella sp. FZLJ2107]UTO21948.1 FxsA family protein [Moraxella sp. FZLJ2109]
MGALVGIALVWFIIEMLVWYLVAQMPGMSGWYVFFWFVAAAFIGLSFIRKAAGTLNPMAQQMKAMQSGVIPNPANQPSEGLVTKAVASGIAGVLFLLPGLISDVAAVVLLLPFVQRKLTTAAKNYAMKNQDKLMKMMANQMGGQSPFGAMGGMGGNPFGGMNGQNPFGQGNPFGQSGFGGTTVDGDATPVNKNVKRITSANDD